jgi:hypothetical protein
MVVGDATDRQSVALAYRYSDALNAREVPDGLLAEGFQMVNAETAITDRTYEGASGVLEWTRDMFEAYAPNARFAIEQIVAAGDDFAVAKVRLEGLGATSGAPLVLRWSAVFRCAGASLTGVVGYLRASEALRAVGLADQPARALDRSRSVE